MYGSTITSIRLGAHMYGCVKSHDNSAITFFRWKYINHSGADSIRVLKDMKSFGVNHNSIQGCVRPLVRASARRLGRTVISNAPKVNQSC